jgi:hypothetical protein
VKRIRTGVIAAIAVLATGVAASACTVAPTAASVNGDTISVASLNAQLQGLTSSKAGQCLLSLDFPQALDLSGTGTGGEGTYSSDFTSLVLGNEVDNILAAQYAGRHHIDVTAQGRSDAESNFATILDGAISAQVQQASAIGGTLGCTKADGTSYTGKSLLAALPADVRSNELANQVIEQYLLTASADLSPTALQNYYIANPTEFIQDCVSVIQTTDQATADTAYNSLKTGASLAQVAAAASTDPSVQTRSGQVGCFPESTILSELQLTSVVVGQPVTPVQSNGTWVVYVVTSRSPIAFDQAKSTITEILTRATANREKVSNEVLRFARKSAVDINPQYGTWSGTEIVTPPSPKAKFLLPHYGSTVTKPTTTTTTTIPSIIGSSSSSSSSSSSTPATSSSTPTTSSSTTSTGS